MDRFHELLQIYDSFHDKPRNKQLHWIGTPPIIIAVMAALSAIPIPEGWRYADLNFATAALVFSLVGYARLSWRIAIGMGLALIALYWVAMQMQMLSPLHYWLTVAALFVGGWIFQLWGHAIQGKNPRFIGQPVFLLVGTSALMCQVYDRLGIRY